MSSNTQFRLLSKLEEYQAQFTLIQLLNPDLTEVDFKHYCIDMFEDNNYSLYAAMINNEIVGLCGCWIATKFYTGKYLEIDNFIIAPGFQGKGIGKEFVQYITTIAQEKLCKIMMLDAYLVNTKAHDFYKQLGFEAKGYHFLYKI